MRNVKLHLVILSAFLLSACSVFTPKKATNEELILGSWNCSQEIKNLDVGGFMKFEIVDVYMDDGTVSSSGSIKLRLNSNVPVVDYSKSAKGTWSITNDKITYVTNEEKVVNISHPELDKVFNLQEELKGNEPLTTNITTLNNSQMILNEEAGGDNGIYKCTR